jgi:hypothetical protein
MPPTKPTALRAVLSPAAAPQEGSLLLAKLEPDDVARPVAPLRGRVVDAGEAGVGVVERHRVDVAGEHVAHADDPVEASRGEEAQRPGAVVAVRGLDVLDGDAQLPSGGAPGPPRRRR